MWVYMAGGRFNLVWNLFCIDILCLYAYLEQCEPQEQENPSVIAQKWGLQCLRPQCCEPRNTGWCEDDRYSAETLLHQACIVKKLSGCHDSIPTGYELIWTWSNTTVFSEEKPPHSHFSYLASELLTLNAKVEAWFSRIVLAYIAVFLRKQFTAMLRV